MTAGDANIIMLCCTAMTVLVGLDLRRRLDKWAGIHRGERHAALESDLKRIEKWRGLRR